ncbi:hypothetical protein [Natronococcus occultus]|uniref:hypothetical protein n=1 Tax=Natronococcus occultus TaxID=29288 RepID=UPI0006778910|nr:hypothetical protein [Natronococcus occultus]
MEGGQVLRAVREVHDAGRWQEFATAELDDSERGGDSWVRLEDGVEVRHEAHRMEEAVLDL